MLTDAQPRLQPVLDGGEAALLQPLRERPYGRRVRHVGERVPAPQRQRVGQDGGRALWLPGGQRPPPRVRHPLEPSCIDVISVDGQPIAGGERVDGHRGEGPPQPGDAGLQRMSGVAGRAVAVEVVDQRVGGDDAAGVGEQEREQCPQRRPADSHLAAVVAPRRRRAEDPEPHPNILPRAST